MQFDKDFWLISRPIAHRGLWNAEFVENSLASYQNAIDNSYPIEIDVYSSKDGELFCFHDHTLDRMTGESGNIYDKTAKEIKNLPLLSTDQKIPTFDEVLRLVDGKVPLLIELKTQPDKSYVKKVVERLKRYKGEFAIQSFNPQYVLMVKKLAPNFIRGILATKTHSKGLPFLRRMVVGNMSLNFLIKPHFISYSYQDLPLKKSKVKDLPVITWTITNQNNYEKVKPFAKNIIFEEFIPKN